MDSPQHPGPGAREPTENQAENGVREFLERNPDFLARHPELVELLSVPHGCAPAQSLIEHQVARLRVRNADLERKLRDLIRTARRNERLSARLHRLSLDLLECDRIQQVFDVLYQGLQRELRADAVAVRLFLNGSVSGVRARAEFVPPSPAERELLDELKVLRAPECGPLTEAYARVLFGWGRPLSGSGVVVPLSVRGCPGVLAVASRERERFHPSMGTLFLQQLGEVLVRVMARLLQ